MTQEQNKQTIGSNELIDEQALQTIAGGVCMGCQAVAQTATAKAADMGTKYAETGVERYKTLKNSFELLVRKTLEDRSPATNIQCLRTPDARRALGYLNDRIPN